MSDKHQYKRLLSAQPRMYDRVRICRGGDLLFGGAPAWAVPGPWDSIAWTDGITEIAPMLTDKWMAYDTGAR